MQIDPLPPLSFFHPAAVSRQRRRFDAAAIYQDDVLISHDADNDDIEL